MTTRQAIGRRGEDAAAEHLRRRGYMILDRNWRTRHGEIDLVAHHRGVLVVVEVKTRTGTGYGLPAESVTPEKLARLRRLAGQWLLAHQGPYRQVRIDVIAVLVTGDDGHRITHYRGVAS